MHGTTKAQSPLVGHGIWIPLNEILCRIEKFKESRQLTTRFFWRIESHFQAH